MQRITNRRRFLLGIGLTSGFITIFCFLTGIGSLPGLFRSSVPHYDFIDVDKEFIVTVPVAVIFSQPSASSEIILTRLHGQSLNVTGEVQGINWLRVGGFGIPAGFVSASALKERPAPDKTKWEKVQYRNDGLFSDTEAYQGEKLNGKRHGRGIYSKKELFKVCVSPCRDVFYAGDFENDVYHGRGMLQYDTETYMGDFWRGNKHGRGVWREEFFNQTYQGEFKDGVFDGEGLFHNDFYFSEIYKGEFRQGSREGEGIEVSSLWLYRGNFENGAYSGEGELLWSDGQRQRGTFEEGKLKKGTKIPGNWLRASSAQQEIAREFNRLLREVKAIRFFGSTKAKA